MKSLAKGVQSPMITQKTAQSSGSAGGFGGGADAKSGGLQGMLGGLASSVGAGGLLGQLGGDIDAEETAFLRAEMAKPVDIAALVAEVPNGLGPKVYAMSLLAIDLESQVEAKYLHGLIKGLGMDPASVNDVHAQLGVPSLYT